MKAIRKTITTNGFETEYFRFGSGSTPLILVPGVSVRSVMGSAQGIAAMYSMFERDFTVYVLDRRKALPDGYGVEDMADDTAAVLDVLGISGACFIGVSQGGAIALTLAAKRHDLVKMLAVEACAAAIGEKQVRVVERWTKAADERDIDALCDSFMESVYTDEYRGKYGEAIRFFLKDVTEAELDRFSALCRGTGGFDISGRLSDIKCPVMILGGENDRIFGADELRLTAEKIGCGLKIFGGYGHAFYDECAEAKKVMLEFFTGKNGEEKA